MRHKNYRARMAYLMDLWMNGTTAQFWRAAKRMNRENLTLNPEDFA